MPRSIHHYRGSLNAAILHYERARALYNVVGNRRRIAICDLNLGEAYRYKGDFKRAGLLFEKAYETFKQVGDAEGQAAAIGNKGQMFFSMRLFKNACDDLQASCRIAEDLPLDSSNRSTILCEMHHSLAMVYLALDEVETAWVEARIAYRLAAEAQSPVELGYANRAIAEVLTTLGRAPEAHFSPDPDVYYQAASEAFHEINAEGEIARTMFAQARSLARRGRRLTAARKLQLAMGIFTRLGMVDDAAKAAEVQLEVL